MTYQASKLMSATTIAVEDATMPETIEAGWVRIKLAAASICGTDMHYFRHFGNAGFALEHAITLGHEACGWVEDANGADLKKGQLVALNPIINCGECAQCQKGLVNLCTAKRFPGSALTKPHIDGFFREYFDFPAFCCRPVADSVKPEHLTFAEPLACALHAVNTGHVKAGDKVLVTGCGPMGLLAIVGAASKGAEVSCLDLRPNTVALGQKVGATHGYVGGQDDLSGLNSQFDVVIEASGAPVVFNQAMDFVRKRGIISMLSSMQSSTLPLNLQNIMLKEIQVLGSFQFNKEFEEAVQVIESGKYDFDQMIAGKFGISDTAEAFDLALSGSKAGKVQLVGAA
ncbi:MAG: alcohol dehydrogenase catalytic domain-containing protein [Asticcacaulis sp.]